MASATVAVLCLADPLEDEDVAQLEFAPSRILPGNAVLAFATASAAARTVQELRARRPFVRAAIDMAEVFVDTQGRPTIDGLEVVDRALRWASAARSGELLLSDVARQLLDRTGTVECEPYDPDNGVYRVVATPQFHQLVPLPRLLASTDVHPFVNRYGPWLALERAWAASCTGERRVILIEGEAGSGKTRLAAEFARRVVTAGGIVLYGGSTESQELPFQPFGEALRPAFEALIQGGGSQPTEPRAYDDLALLFPWAGTPGSTASARPLSPRRPESDRHWAFEAVVDLLVAATELAPVLVVLDDLHWAQRPTVRLLEHLLRSGRLGRLCIVAAARDEPSDRTEAFVASVATWSRTSGIVRVGLERFDETGTRRFVANATGTLAESLPAALEPVVHHLSAGSGGNAFFLVELWQQLLDTAQVRRDGDRWKVEPLQPGDTPRSVRELVDQRLAKLESAARRSLEVAACIGESFDVRLVAAATQSRVEDVLDVAAAGTACGVLRWLGAGRVGFVHALVRHAIEASLVGGDRARHHLAIARALLETGGAEAARLARHFAAAVPVEPPATAVRYAREAARCSIETVSFDDAIVVLRDVLAVVEDDGDRGELLVDLAAAYARSGDSSAAMRCGEAAAELARRRGDRASLTRAAKAMSEATWRGALPGGPAASVLHEALTGEVDPVTRCELLGALSGALALNGEEDASRAASDEAIALAATLRQPRLFVDAIHNRLYATVLPENVEDQLELSVQALAVAMEQGDELAELRLLCKVMLRLFVRFDPPELAKRHARVAVLAPRFRQPYYLLVHAGNETAMALAEGRFADAEAAAERYREWSEVNHQGDGTYGIHVFSIRREQGRLAELRPLLELAARLRREDTSWAPGLAALYAEAGMASEATALLDRLAAGGLASLPEDSMLPGVISYLADAAFFCGHREVARLVLPRLAPYAGLGVYLPGLACYGAADRYLGRLHSTLGEDRAARDAFEAALELDRRTGWSTWIAHSAYALATQLAARPRSGDKERARALCAESTSLASALGMAALESRCSALAQRMSEGISESAARLTNREREVLQLLSLGRSNRTIGEELHASQHTIANHVRSILAKTGASNRTEAASWAHRHGEI